MPAGGGIMPFVIIFVIYFLFIDKWNRKKYKDIVKFTSWTMPLMILDASLQENAIRTFALDNGYYLYSGPSGESPANSLGNLRSDSDKQVLKRNTNNDPVGINKYNFYDSNGDELRGTLDMTNPKSIGLTGEVSYNATIKNKEGKSIVTYTINVRNGKISDYYDYDKNILTKGCEYKWDLSGYIFKNDWRDIKDWIFNKFK
jgi:hypothetical protein